MGITGLLPVLASIGRAVTLEELRGRRVAVDAYVWLHKAAFTCASEICLDLPTDKSASHPASASPVPALPCRPFPANYVISTMCYITAWCQRPLSLPLDFPAF